METPYRFATMRDRPKLCSSRPEQILPPLRGLDVRKYPAAGGVFFLDIPFYRTSQDLGANVLDFAANLEGSEVNLSLKRLHHGGI
jgi:hypothetical protein